MGKNIATTNQTFFFCDGGSCQKAGSEPVIRTARAYLRNQGLWESTHTIKTRCNGRCEDAPTCIVQNGNYWYKNTNINTIVPILKSHLEHNKPISEHLLFQPEWESVDSDKERKRVKPKAFSLTTDEDLGKVWLTKGFSSDQYLYPLFVHLFNTKPDAVCTWHNGTRFNLNTLTNVEYTDPYTMSLHIGEHQTLELIIGSVPKRTDFEAISNQKIGATEYYMQADQSGKGIRLRNKLGECVATIELGLDNQDIWTYCETIQLIGISVPKQEIVHE